MAYSFTGYEPARMARASLKDAGISFKKSVELSKRLRGMMSDKAEAYLEQVVAKRQAVPFTRYTNGAGHRAGDMMAGKYPVKAASEFLALIRQGVANAESRGLGTPLRIIHIMAQPAATPSHYGRARGHAMKRAHVELVLAETEESKRREKKQKRSEKAEKRAAEKAAEKAADGMKPAEKRTDEMKADEKKATEKPETVKADVKADVPEKKEAKRPAPKRAPAEKKTTPKPAKKE